MQICNKTAPIVPISPPKLIIGNLYKCSELPDVYMCAYENRLINLSYGSGCAGTAGFGCLRDYGWKDVTDKYCLKEL